MFSKPCQYAILALAYLADQEPKRRLSIRAISEHAGVPLPFLSKILGTLARSGLISAQRGPGGGVTLGRPSEKIALGDIIETIDGPLEDGRCVLGFPECDENNPCLVHESWKSTCEHLKRTLYKRPLSELSTARRQLLKRRRPGNVAAGGRASRKD